MERKIGEIFEFNDDWYQCIKQPEDFKGKVCKICAFQGTKNCDIDKCSESFRSDKNDVIFKKLEKIGKPYGDCGIILQGFKTYTNVRNTDTKGLKLYIYSNNTIGIEIKQTKEDMEEKKVRLKKEDIDFLCNKFIEIIEDCVIKGYNIDNVQHEFGKLFLMIKDSDTKLNLKPFDLEAAKAGKSVCTRDGRKARIICFDAKGDYPIIALVDDTTKETNLHYTVNGRAHAYTESYYDLMMLSEKKEGWIIVSKNATIYDSLEDARKSFDSDKELCICKVEWEE